MAQQTFPGDYRIDPTVQADQRQTQNAPPKKTPWWMYALGAVVLIKIVK